MKNKDKYAKEIEKITIRNLAVVNGQPRNCLETDCAECDLWNAPLNNGVCDENLAEWLEDEE